MPDRERVLVTAALIAAVLLGGCGPAVQQTVPYLTNVREARKEVRGAQVRVKFKLGRLGPERPDIAGELIAAGADSVWILADRRLVTIATRELVNASLDVFEGVEAGWWQPPVEHLDRPRPLACARLARHARFPQGLAAGLDRDALAPPEGSK